MLISTNIIAGASKNIGNLLTTWKMKDYFSVTF